MSNGEGIRTDTDRNLSITTVGESSEWKRDSMGVVINANKKGKIENHIPTRTNKENCEMGEQQDRLPRRKTNPPNLRSHEEKKGDNKDNETNSKDRKKGGNETTNNVGLKIKGQTDWSGPVTRARSRAQRTACI